MHTLISFNNVMMKEQIWTHLADIRHLSWSVSLLHVPEESWLTIKCHFTDLTLGWRNSVLHHYNISQHATEQCLCIMVCSHRTFTEHSCELYPMKN